jgi:hypothetical protein
VRQRQPAGSAPLWIMLLFTFGTVGAAMLAMLSAGTMLRPAGARTAAEAQALLAFWWAVFLYGTVLAGVQVAALVGLAGSREWGRIVATLACLLWCLTGLGLVVAFPVLYYLWRPQPFRR